MERQLLAAGILAGGAGRRFSGRDKGWLILGGQPLVQHVVRRLRPHADALLISANRHGDRYAALADLVVADAQADYAGPMAGVRALWSACAHPYLVVAPVDAVRLPEDYVARMVDGLAAADADIAVASIDGDAHYPCCLLRRERLAEPPGHGSLRAWMGAHRTVEVALPAGSILSVNSPQELRALESSGVAGAEKAWAAGR